MTSRPLPGLNDFPEKDRPPVMVPFVSYHLMVGVGSLLAALSFLGLFLLWRGALFTSRTMMGLFVVAVLGPIVCNQAGWVAAEVGRQPFIVYPNQSVAWDGGKAKVTTSYEGLRTSAGVSNRRVVTAPQVLSSILMFGFVYVLLFLVWVYVLNDKIQHGPDDHPAEPKATSAEGLLDAAAANKPAGGDSLMQGRSEAQLVGPSEMEPTALQLTWFVLLGVLMAGYAILDGFDLGVGILHMFARDDHERRIFMNSIGPLWDGNEVWLVVFGGATFAAFPNAYAAAFSGFYLGFMLLLCCLIFRGVSMEFRSKLPSRSWRGSWDVAFSASSALATFLFGVVVGDCIQRVAAWRRRRFHAATVPRGSPQPLLDPHRAVRRQRLRHARLDLPVPQDRGPVAGTNQGLDVEDLLPVPGGVPGALGLDADRPARLDGELPRQPWLWVVPFLNVLAIANVPRDLPRQAVRRVPLVSGGDRGVHVPVRGRPVPQPHHVERRCGVQPDRVAGRERGEDPGDHSGRRRPGHAVRAGVHGGGLLGIPR